MWRLMSCKAMIWPNSYGTQYNFSLMPQKCKARRANYCKHGLRAAVALFKSYPTASASHQAHVFCFLQFRDMATSAHLDELQSWGGRVDPGRFNVPVSEYRY